ncbi:hypothetical protein ABZ154_21115 [Streptomyces sp. NPDC006261]|uniref:hypothetical protein n=1 Tax=Streptomyces sp. NPDC006261 TaxID=3156739 RepID=UPI0033B665A4
MTLAVQGPFGAEAPGEGPEGGTYAPVAVVRAAQVFLGPVGPPKSSAVEEESGFLARPARWGSYARHLRRLAR